ncbi:MAG TPA: site-2 protease family protein [Magnetospirillum sp.]|jgi:Zn-dependent protease|nr:site-2 protease family protein [Magnetospirillum sp.]
MFGRTLPLFRLLGLEVRLHPSWVGLAGLMIWGLGGSYFPQVVPDLREWQGWGLGVVATLGASISLVAHEMAHAVVGRRDGIPFNGITLFLFGGVAELEAEPHAPGPEARMAVAGPLLSIAAAGLFRGLTEMVPGGGAAAALLDYLFFINLALAGFNLLPAFPLDGGRILRAALWRWRGDQAWATRRAATGSGALGLALMGVGIWQMMDGAYAVGVWWMVIGFFVRFAAFRATRSAQAMAAMPERPT